MCFFPKILKYSGLLPFCVFPRCKCVYKCQAGRTPVLQQNWQSSEKSQDFKEKTLYLMNTLYVKQFKVSPFSNKTFICKMYVEEWLKCIYHLLRIFLAWSKQQTSPDSSKCHLNHLKTNNRWLLMVFCLMAYALSAYKVGGGVGLTEKKGKQYS